VARTCAANFSVLHDELAVPELGNDGAQDRFDRGRIGHHDDDHLRVTHGALEVFLVKVKGLRRAVPRAHGQAVLVQVPRPGAANDAQAENGDALHTPV
jgi:hypothetical protein